ncbi:MAG: transposase [Clostridia bacterium]|nr:transposase [Clostridia bacterium]
MPPNTFDAKNHETIASENSETHQDSYEALITNLPPDDFPPDRLKELYNRRWGIESSFRDLKYSIGLTRFHASKPLFIQQEIWARLISYNFTSAIVSFVHIPDADLKYAYKVNFSAAASICRNFLRSSSTSSPVLLLARELIPIRPDRSFPRLKTAHFRRPAYFIYRPACSYLLLSLLAAFSCGLLPRALFCFFL